jgi:hypothetical protein
MAPQNKYADLALLKLWGQFTTADSDLVLQSNLDWAEGEFERLTASQFDQATVTTERAAQAFVDNVGVLHFISNSRAPITSVTAASVRYLAPLSPATVVAATGNWITLAWNNTDDAEYPSAVMPPRPEAWEVSILPNNVVLPQVDTIGLWVRWSGQAGYVFPVVGSVAPNPLQAMILRLAMWKYKLGREAPLGKVASPPFGITEVIPALPADIAMDLMRWTRLPA